MVTLKMTIEKYFFKRKTCRKNLPTKLVKKIVKKKIANQLFLPKIFFNGYFEGNHYSEYFFFEIAKKLRSGPKKHSSGLFLTGLFPRKRVI